MKASSAVSAGLLIVAGCSFPGLPCLRADPLPPASAPLGRQIAVAAPGNYADIDAKGTMDTMRVLVQGTTAEQESLARQITGHSDQYAPPVFYVLAAVLMRGGQPEDALFWWCAAIPSLRTAPKPR